jgi:D-alanyl-D-alanine carboxypeptidase (penicillin-binding protein 5/6)
MKFALILLFLILPLPSTAVEIALQPAPALAAKSYVLYDYTSNQVLVSKNGDERVEPASLTKLMTAYITFSAIKQGKLSL